MKKHLMKDGHMFVRWLLLALLMLVNGNVIMAQGGKTTINGVVTDELGEPLIGVNIMVKGTTNGTITDLDGKYSITADVQQKTIIVYSFMGYITCIKDGYDHKDLSSELDEILNNLKELEKNNIENLIPFLAE